MSKAYCSLTRKVSESFVKNRSQKDVLREICALRVSNEELSRRPAERRDAEIQYTGWCYASQRRLAGRAGCSVETAARAIQELKNAGLVVVRSWRDKRGHPHNEYFPVESEINKLPKWDQRPKQVSMKRKPNGGTFTTDHQPHMTSRPSTTAEPNDYLPVSDPADCPSTTGRIARGPHDAMPVEVGFKEDKEEEIEVEASIKSFSLSSEFKTSGYGNEQASSSPEPHRPGITAQWGAKVENATETTTQSVPTRRSRDEVEQIIDQIVAAAIDECENVGTPVFYTKDRTALGQIISQTDWTVKELTAATRSLVGSMDQYALRRAGDSVVATLRAQVLKERADKERHQRTEELLRRASEQSNREREAHSEGEKAYLDGKPLEANPYLRGSDVNTPIRVIAEPGSALYFAVLHQCWNEGWESAKQEVEESPGVFEAELV